MCSRESDATPVSRFLTDWNTGGWEQIRRVALLISGEAVFSVNPVQWFCSTESVGGMNGFLLNDLMKKNSCGLLEFFIALGFGVFSLFCCSFEE